MELVEGRSLTAVIRSDDLSLDAFFDLAIPLAGAVSAAHQKGITHRDLKPDNIMVGGDAHVKVLDFGLAKLRPEPVASSTAPTQTVTQDGRLLGTLPYMSPEQLQGKSVDHRSDIFSLGIILYEMLAGRHPFQGATQVDLISSIMRDTPRSVSESNRELPPDLHRIIGRCLEKDPERRWQAALDLRNELEDLQGESAKAEPSVPFIAVLPFEDMSPEKDQDYFCEGVSEEIINALAKVEGLRVISRMSAFQFKSEAGDIRDIGRRLGVSSVLGGSVRKAGKRLRITARLVSVADDYHLWSERYDREMQDVFAVQDEIAEKVVQALRVTLSPEKQQVPRKAPTANVQAYDYYLRGRKFFYRHGQSNFEFARQMFSKAIEIDPGFALAYAGIADCRSFSFHTWTDSDLANLEQAVAAGRRALELDPKLAQAHASHGLALSLTGRYKEADQAFETAIDLDPTLFEAAYFRARTFAEAGKPEQAVRWFEKASELRPEDYQALMMAPQLYRRLGRESEEESAFRRGLRNAERHLELNPDDVRAWYLGAGALAGLGEKRRSLEWADRALAIGPEEPHVLYNVACAYSLGGDVERAIRALEKSIRFGQAYREWIEHDSDLDALRADPRFQALVEQLEYRREGAK
jgi:TolB-like protein/Flp pilus assembly protein TadD